MDKKKAQKKLVTISTYLLIFLILIMINMYFIKNNLDSQIPYTFEQLADIGGEHKYELKFLNIPMQTTNIIFYENGGFEARFTNHTAHYIVPVVLAIAMLMIVVFVVSKLKKIISKHTL